MWVVFCLSAVKINLPIKGQTVILLLFLQSSVIFVQLMELFLIFKWMNKIEAHHKYLYSQLPFAKLHSQRIFNTVKLVLIFLALPSKHIRFVGLSICD